MVPIRTGSVVRANECGRRSSSWRIRCGGAATHTARPIEPAWGVANDWWSALQIPHPADETDICREQTGKPRTHADDEKSKRQREPNKKGLAHMRCERKSEQRQQRHAAAPSVKLQATGTCARSDDVRERDQG